MRQTHALYLLGSGQACDLCLHATQFVKYLRKKIILSSRIKTLIANFANTTIKLTT